MRGWYRAIVRIVEQVGQDNLGLVAAGIAFYALLALFPALAGLVSMYGVLASPADVVEVVRAVEGVLPGDLVQIVVAQLESLTGSDETALSAGAVLGLVVSIWSANRGTKALVSGLNIAYNQRESRNFLQLNALSLGVTALTLAFLAVSIAAITVVPILEVGRSLGPVMVEIVRFLGLAVVMLSALAFLYRLGPNRRSPRWQWVTVGSVFATVLWLLACRGFGLYVDTFGSYNETFGALAGVVITMTWLWMTAFVVLLGAEVNAELEHETLADSTVGPDRPVGQRGAFVADDVPEGVQRALRGR